MSEVVGVPKIAVIYYSQTGTVHALAESIAAGARTAGADVKVRRVRELAPDEAIASDPAWTAHLASTQHVDEAAPDDIVWLTE